MRNERHELACSAEAPGSGSERSEWETLCIDTQIRSPRVGEEDGARKEKDAGSVKKKDARG